MEKLPGCRGCSGVCHCCDKHVDDAIDGCDCEYPQLKEDILMSENLDNIIPGPGSDAGASEPINDDGFQAPTEEEVASILGDQEVPGPAPVDADPAPAEEPEEAPIAFAVHLILLQNGQFAIQATGEPNIGEMQMLISRGLESVKARMVAETVAQVMTEHAKPKSRIITPSK